MRMRVLYETPEMEVIKYIIEDIVTLSVGDEGGFEDKDW